MCSLVIKLALNQSCTITAVAVQVQSRYAADGDIILHQKSKGAGKKSCFIQNLTNFSSTVKLA